MKTEQQKLLLNLGSGATNFGPEWIHIDVADFNHIQGNDVALNGWSNNSVDLIYSSHMLEYFSRKDAEFLLKNWFNVLKPGGIIRLSVPDFYILSMIYNKNNNLDDILGPLYGQMGMNQDTIYHKTCYDVYSLGSLLKKVGFKDIKRWDWRINPVDDCSAAHWPHRPENIKNRKFDDDQILISLNLEAKK